MSHFITVLMVFLLAEGCFASLDGTSTLEIESYNIDSTKDYYYKDAFELRENRMVGVGVNLGGSTGLFGFNVELNLDAENSFITGFGSGSGYRSVAMEWKRLFGGESISPFVRMGYAGWFNSTGNSPTSSSSPLLKNFLTQDEINRGNYRIDILSVGGGLEYHFLSGEYSGFGIFAQAIFMLGFSNDHLVPTGSVGSLYYF